MADEMFLSPDQKSLRRGRRRSARTETCRPCVVWAADDPEIAYRGVVLDVSPYGMCIRMLDYLPPNTNVQVQLMRDDTFESPLSIPFEGLVVRTFETEQGFMDHGIEVQRSQPRRPEEGRPTRIERRDRRNMIGLGGQSRMHTLDFTVGDQGPRRTGR